MKTFKFILVICLVGIFTGCSYYTRKNPQLQAYINEGRVKEAHKLLSHEEKWEKNEKDLLLYYLNRATVAWMLGYTEESITYFKKADYYIEDFRKTNGQQVLASLTNPMALPYGGEIFEKVMVHYYQVLNYIQINDYNSAIVQCRRLILTLDGIKDLYKQKDKYQNGDTKSVESKYNRDAFGHTLLGLVYDANKDYNNAFIAYRNAYEIYKEDYIPNFGIHPPEQLKKDLMRTAHIMGFQNDLQFYEREFGMKYRHDTTQGGDLVFFWNNGLGPVKSEWSINFELIRGTAGWVTFANEQYGFSIPVYVGDYNTNDEYKFSDLEYVRIAFPKYLERAEFFTKGVLKVNDKTYPLQEAEDVNQIAFKSLKDRMLREVGNALFRAAVKKAAEYAAREENPDAGAALGIVNALTERADTRNWQTLPHTVYYTRVKLPEGNHKVQLVASSAKTQVSRSFDFNFDIKNNRTTFHSYQTLDNIATPYYHGY